MRSVAPEGKAVNGRQMLEAAMQAAISERLDERLPLAVEHQRVRNRRVKRPIAIALGVWPKTDQALVLDWMLGDSENDEEWTRFLSRLEEAGICGDQGLIALISQQIHTFNATQTST